VDSILKRSERYGLQDSDKYLFRRAIALCAFVDEPEKWIAKMREAIAARHVYWYDLREIVNLAPQREVAFDAAPQFSRAMCARPALSSES
jgi:hypothetical protein